jgi:Carboxypeptidase regulatory-like domain/TonB-dependent Receptor Plug Domain
MSKTSVSLSRVRHYLALGALCSVPFLATDLGAQQRTTVLDRAAQERDRAAAAARRLAGAQSVIDGVVTDTLLRPLVSADISVVGTSARVVTGENGRFRMLQVPPGQYLIVVRRIGFAPTSGIIEVPADDTLRLAYTLARTTSLLDTIRVRETRISMRMAEFEQRKAQGVGQFITQEQIDRRGSGLTSDFLRNVSGVDVSTLTNTVFAGKVALSKREGGSLVGEGTGACAMQIILDGIVMPRFFNLDLLPPPKQIAGIEVYKGAATVPIQFGGADRRCGMIIFWTREGY